MEDLTPMFMVTEVLDNLVSKAEVVGPLEVEGEEKCPSSTPENSASKGVGEQVQQFPKAPTEKQAEGPVEGCLESPQMDQLEGNSKCKFKSELKH